MNPTAAIVANAAILGWIVYAAALQLLSPDFYYMSVQEDEYLEWATFWAFMFAAAVQLSAARTGRAQTSTRVALSAGLAERWFAAGVALFCFFVAMEEISWGQRLLSYKPPEYFLRENFQQEPNIHNVFDTSLRKLTLQFIIAGYGIILPLAAYARGIGPLLARLGITAPTRALIPGFAGTLALYVIYPWSFSGEIVELMLGLGFLFAALWYKRPTTALIACVTAAVLVLGFATTMTARVRKSSDEAYVHMAQTEVEALGNDFLDASRPTKGQYLTRCNLHKRVYTYVEKYRKGFLAHGRFSQLAAGHSRDRFEYFLDPWNVPYWIRDNCDDDTETRSIFVYSFGPNHRRDSSNNELRADDVGFYILAPSRED